MTVAHARHAQVVRHALLGTAYSHLMTKLDAKESTRSLTVVLAESDWQALRSVEPDAIGWLQDRIRERLRAEPEQATPHEPSRTSSPETYWGGDEY